MALRSIDSEPSAIGNDGLRTFNALYSDLDLLDKTTTFASNSLRSHEDGKDAAMVGYAKLAAKISRDPDYIQSDDKLKLIVFRTVVRVCGDIARYRNLQKRRTVQLDDDQADLWDGFLDAETATIWRDALSELPEQYREAVILRFVVGLSGLESAEFVGISEIAFKSRLHRGRTLLKAKLLQAGIPGS